MNEDLQPSAEPEDVTDTSEEPVSVEDDVRAALESFKEEEEAPEAGAEAEQPDKAEKAPEENRDEKGRFAKKKEEGEEAAKAEDAQSSASEAPKTDTPAEQEEQETKAAPPPGWSIESKAAWDNLPPHLQQDIAKREQEVSDGFAMYSGLKPYIERAQKSGQNLPDALKAYTGIEELLQQDTDKGFLHIANNLGLTQHQAGQMFARLAQNLGISPPQGQHAPSPHNDGGSPGNQTAGADPRMLQQALSPVMQRLESLEGTFKQQSEAERARAEAAVETVVERFRKDPDYRYFNDVEETITQMFASGLVTRTGDHAADLQQAYEQAIWAHPEIRKTLINGEKAKLAEEQKAKAAASKRAAVSINGAPMGSPAPSTGSVGNVEDDVRAAFEQIRSTV